MSFLVFMVILLWLIGWPIFSYLYFKAEDQPDTPASQPIKRIIGKQVKVMPQFEGDKALVTMKIDGQVFVGNDDDITELISRLKSSQMSARTMNEIQQLGG